MRASCIYMQHVCIFSRGGERTSGEKRERDGILPRRPFCLMSQLVGPVGRANSRSPEPKERRAWRRLSFLFLSGNSLFILSISLPFATEKERRNSIGTSNSSSTVSIIMKSHNVSDRTWWTHTIQDLCTLQCAWYGISDWKLASRVERINGDRKLFLDVYWHKSRMVTTVETQRAILFAVEKLLSGWDRPKVSTVLTIATQKVSSCCTIETVEDDRIRILSSYRCLILVYGC